MKLKWKYLEIRDPEKKADQNHRYLDTERRLYANQVLAHIAYYCLIKQVPDFTSPSSMHAPYLRLYFKHSILINILPSECAYKLNTIFKEFIKIAELCYLLMHKHL